MLPQDEAGHKDGEYRALNADYQVTEGKPTYNQPNRQTELNQGYRR